MNAKKPCVLLYNPISGHGHLDSWHALFVELLLQRGYHVVALTSGVSALRTVLEQNGLAAHPRLTLSAWDSPPSVLAVREWRYVHGGAGRVSRNMPVTLILRRLALAAFFKIEHAVRKSLLRLWRRLTLGPDANGVLLPGDMAERIRAARDELKLPVDFLFIMYMDMFHAYTRQWKRLDRTVRLPWGGIRFAPPPLAGGKAQERYYTLHSLRGMCFLEEDACAAYARAVPEKTFQLLPDITAGTLPDVEPESARKLREAARGRCVVLLGGTLDHRKNIEGFCTLAEAAAPDAFLFAMVGRLYESSFTDADRAALETFRRNARGNTFLLPEYLTDERDFNALIAASDILFAVYKKFRGSSNMLTKAAYFGKPILVSDGYLMGKKVQTYKTGLAVPEEDPGMRRALEALETLRAVPIQADCRTAYCRACSPQAMGDALETFIQKGLAAR